MSPPRMGAMGMERLRVYLESETDSWLLTSVTPRLSEASSPAARFANGDGTSPVSMATHVSRQP
jgi:hypothetical protein